MKPSVDDIQHALNKAVQIMLKTTQVGFVTPFTITITIILLKLIITRIFGLVILQVILNVIH